MSILGCRTRRVSLSGLSFPSLKRSGCWLAIPAVLVAMGCSGLPELPLDGLPLSPVSSLVEADPAITTNIRDARTEVPFLDGFTGSDPVSLLSLRRGPNNGFLLPGPGSYALSTQSYCLHAGTYGPTDGDGYIYAPLLGPRAALIQRLVQNSVDHPEVPQRDVQTLIWAIQAHARLYDAPLEVQRTAAALLSEDDLRSLEDVAVSILAGAVREQAYAHLPQGARRVLRAEDDLRRMLTEGRSSYEELERTAVLVGVPPREDDDRDVPRGRWSYHPDGFFIRYYPSGYARTEVQVYWPEPMVFERDGAGRIAAVADFRGNRVGVEYENATASTVPTVLAAYAFQGLRFTQYTAVGPELGFEETNTLAGAGWTLVGPLPGGDEAVVPAQDFQGVDARFQAAREFQRQLRALTGQAPGLGRRLRPGTSAYKDFIDLVHLDQGLRDAVETTGRSGIGPWAAGSGFGAAEVHAALDIVTKAWLQLLVADESPPEPDPSSLPHSSPSDGGGQFPEPVGGPLPKPVGGDGRVSGPAIAGEELPILAPDAWISALLPSAPAQEEGVCDDLGGDSGGGQEFDPSDGAATPGSTGRQRLLPSARNADDENPDCGKVAELLEGLTKVRDAYASNPPRPGENGFDYGRRIEVDGFGYGKPGGATSPAATEIGSCVILGNKAYYASRPPVERAADCAHEKTHQAQCRAARNSTFGGFEGWLMNARNYRQAELDAYNAGIQTVEDWMAANGCSRG